MRKYVPIQAPTLERRSSDSYVYQEYMPSRSLISHVVCYWTLDCTAVSPSTVPHRILPDGCADIIFNLKAQAASISGFITGLMSSYEEMRFTEDQSLLGIRFFAETVRPFIRFPASEFRAGPVFSEEVWGLEANRLNEEMVTAPDTASRMDLIETFLLNVLSLNNVRSDTLLESGIQYLYDARGRITVRALAEKLSYSERNIRRTVQKELGMTPKELTDIIRFQNVLQEMQRNKNASFPEIAASYGYYDQSHFINSFKRLYGMSPHQAFKT